jgi:hypothetical protein
MKTIQRLSCVLAVSLLLESAVAIYHFNDRQQAQASQSIANPSLMAGQGGNGSGGNGGNGGGGSSGGDSGSHGAGPDSIEHGIRDRDQVQDQNQFRDRDQLQAPDPIRDPDRIRDPDQLRQQDQLRLHDPGHELLHFRELRQQNREF